MNEAVETFVAEAIGTYQTEILPLGPKNLDTGRSCAVCDSPEYEIVEEAAVCTIEEHEEQCDCGGTASIRLLRVEIDGKLPFSKSKVTRKSCTDCNSVDDSTVERVLRYTSPNETKTFREGTEVFVHSNPIHRHHTSYDPPKIREVCEVCHSRIHNSSDFRPDLKPDLSREEFEAMNDE